MCVWPLNLNADLRPRLGQRKVGIRNYTAEILAQIERACQAEFYWGVPVKVLVV